MTNKNHKHFIQKACEQEILLVSACRPGIAGSIPARRRSKVTSYPNRPYPRKMVSAQTVAIRPAAAYSGFRFRRIWKDLQHGYKITAGDAQSPQAALRSRPVDGAAR